MYPESCPHPSDTWGNDTGQVWEGCHKLMFLKEDDTRLRSTPLSEAWDTFQLGDL